LFPFAGTERMDPSNYRKMRNTDGAKKGEKTKNPASSHSSNAHQNDGGRDKLVNILPRVTSVGE